jgi:hypothetical protein
MPASPPARPSGSKPEPAPAPVKNEGAAQGDDTVASKFKPGRDFERRSSNGSLRGVEVKEEDSAEAWEAFQAWQTLNGGPQAKAPPGFETTNPAPLPSDSE